MEMNISSVVWNFNNGSHAKLQVKGLSQDFHNRVSKLGFHEFRVSKIPDRKSRNNYTDYVMCINK